MTDTAQHPVVDPHDLALMSDARWLPVTNVAVLEDLRAQHLTLIEQRDKLRVARRRVEVTFQDEGRAYQDALDASYRDGSEDGLPERTSATDRAAALADAEAHLRAATTAVESFALDVLVRLRGGDLPPAWNTHVEAAVHHVPPGGLGAELMAYIDGQAARLQRETAEAQRIVNDAASKLRALSPLRTWVVRNANGGTGQILHGSELEVPEAFTPGTKPRDLEVPGWWPDPDGEDLTYDSDDDIPADAEEGVVEMSDPWFIEQERRA